MTAGMNVLVNIWRMTTDDDDAVGGASITGTVVYEQYPIRMQPDVEEQIFLEQGLETVRTFTATFIPGTVSIFERDELEIIKPYNHPYVNDRFRIITMRHSDFSPGDPRGYVILKLTRSVRAHDIQ